MRDVDWSLRRHWEAGACTGSGRSSMLIVTAGWTRMSSKSEVKQVQGNGHVGTRRRWVPAWESGVARRALDPLLAGIQDGFWIEAVTLEHPIRTTVWEDLRIFVRYPRIRKCPKFIYIYIYFGFLRKWADPCLYFSLCERIRREESAVLSSHFTRRKTLLSNALILVWSDSTSS